MRRVFRSARLSSIVVVLAFAVGAVAASSFATRSASPSFVRSDLSRVVPNRVTAENARPGTSDWRISQVASDEVSKQVLGFASATSVNAGEQITFYVTVNPAQTFSIDIYRIGYYQGQGGRLMRRVSGVDGRSQPGCASDAMTGMLACTNWSPSYQFTVPARWTSGIYLAKLTNSRGYQNYIVFAVREDDRESALLYQQSVTTYQAYNNYPNDLPAQPATTVPATGKSLYEFNSSASRTGLGETRATAVSFDRPYSGDDGAGQFFDHDVYFVWWLEENGYDVSYSTNIDTHDNGHRLLNYRAFLSVGHDEYWSAQMRDAVEAAQRHGVSLGFFGANAAYWQIRLEPSSTGEADRIQVCYKSAELDPVQDSNITLRWRDRRVGRPEQALIGVMSTGQQPNGAELAPYVVKNPANWVYAGTGLADGDAIPGIVGYEADRQVSESGLPAARAGTYTILSDSPYTSVSTGPALIDHSNSTVYQAASGAWVFAAGSIGWAKGLYNFFGNNYADPRIQRMTANVLGTFTAGNPGEPPATGAAARPALHETATSP
jgi:hypothetical protein